MENIENILTLQPPSMDFSLNIADNWRKFRQRFELYIDETGLSKKTEKRKTSVLLSIIGAECTDIYNTFEFPPPRAAVPA
jgi:hypothetical protein